MFQRGILASLCILTGACSAHAQASSETAYQLIRLQVFGVGSYVRPANGPVAGGAGLTTGGSIGTSIPHVHHIEPSLEVRYTYANSSSVTETSFGGGLRVAYNASRVHPYGDFLVSKGNITLNYPPFAGTPGEHNDSLVKTYGGGLDYDLTRNWAIRADVQRQDWQITERNPVFHPVHASLGLRYQFGFGNR